jgi:hypothetical protein
MACMPEGTREEIEHRYRNPIVLAERLAADRPNEFDGIRLKPQERGSAHCRRVVLIRCIKTVPACVLLPASEYSMPCEPANEFSVRKWEMLFIIDMGEYQNYHQAAWTQSQL